MVLILDGNSEQVAHACRKLGLFEKKHLIYLWLLLIKANFKKRWNNRDCFLSVHLSQSQGCGSGWNKNADPDPDPTCNNGFIKLFLSWTKYKSESTNSSIKWWVIISNFIPIYLKYKYIFFFFSISGRIRSRSRIRIRNFFSAEPDPDPW